MSRIPEKPGRDLVGFMTETTVQTMQDCGFHCDLQGTSSLKRDIETLRRRASLEGIGFFTKSLPALGRSLDKALSSDNPLDCNHSFQLSKSGTGLPIFMGAFFKRIFDTREQVIVGPSLYSIEQQVQAVRAVRQVTYLFYKLELPYEPSQEEEVIERFIANDSILPEVGAEIPLSPMTSRALENARMIIWYVLKDYNPSEVVPRHGPGATATGEKQWEKFNFRHFYPSLDEEWSYPDFFFLNYQHLCDELNSLTDMELIHDPTAKVALVPKDSRGPRVISMEPLELQWIQQGVMRSLYSLMERSSSPTCGYVNFTNQEVNRALALDNSFDGSKITMDLKDASDRVSTWLVKKLLPTHVFNKLNACRSTMTTLPDGRIVRLKKFAPMGSGICFPVEALIFWALAVGTLQDGHSLTRERQIRSLKEEVYVYGDDIILNAEGYESVKAVYEECFLTVNVDKCCTGRFFRESCGMDAFKLNEVTPVRIKTPLSQLPLPAACLAWVGYVNNLRARGYSLTADHLQNVITHRVPFPIPVARSEQAINLAYWEPCLDEGTLRDYLTSAFKCRYNKQYCREEVRIPICVPRSIKAGRDGWSALFSSLISKGGPPDPFGFDTREREPDRYSVPKLTQLGWKWVDINRLIFQPDRIS